MNKDNKNHKVINSRYFLFSLYTEYVQKLKLKENVEYTLLRVASKSILTANEKIIEDSNVLFRTKNKQTRASIHKELVDRDLISYEHTYYNGKQGWNRYKLIMPDLLADSTYKFKWSKI